MALTSEQVLGLVAKVENATDADKRLAALQVLEATLDGAAEIPDSDAVIQILKVSVKNANQAVSAAALAFLPSLFTSLAAPTVAHNRILPSSVAHVRAAVHHLMPILIEKLGDQKERVREATRRALTQLGSSAFIVSPPPDPTPGARKGKELETPLMIYERLMKDNALGAKAARVKEQATLILPALKNATQDRFPVRLLLPALVTLLSDADPSVREGSRASLVALFVNSTPGAKAGLKKELERQDVRKATLDAIVKEVLAGPSAIPQPVASHASVPAASAQAAVVQAASGGSVVGAAAAALGAAEDDVPPVYIASKQDLDRTFTSMLPYFEGKETEENWLSREQSVLKIRGLLKTGAHNNYRAAFVDGIKNVHEAILKALVSLRTTMAIHACSLLSELAQALGDSLEQLADTFVGALLRMAGMTKKLVAASTQAAAREFFINVSFKHSFAVLLSGTMQEKTASSRQAAIEHVCTVLRYQATTRKHALDSHSSYPLLENTLKRALTDHNKDVRAKARETFWVFHAIWPAQASAILEASDATNKKTILASVPAPGSVLLLTPDKSASQGHMAHTAPAALAAAAHQQLAASAPLKKPSFSQSIGPGAPEFGFGVAPKVRAGASTASTASAGSTASAPPAAAPPAGTAASATTGAAPKRRAIGPSAALLAAKREATLRMRAEAAAQQQKEQEAGGLRSSGIASQDVGDDSEGGDNWMADFQPSKPVASQSSSSRSAFTPARARSPPAAPASGSSSVQQPHAPSAQEPPRFVSKYGHDAILGSPPRQMSHIRSLSHKSIDEGGSPSRIPLPTSPRSPRRSDSPLLLSSPRSRSGSGVLNGAAAGGSGVLAGLGFETATRLPRPSTDLSALAGEEDADTTQLLSMPGPDASIDLMMFSSSSPATTPVAKDRRMGPVRASGLSQATIPPDEDGDEAGGAGDETVNGREAAADLTDTSQAHDAVEAEVAVEADEGHTILQRDAFEESMEKLPTPSLSQPATAAQDGDKDTEARSLETGAGDTTTQAVSAIPPAKTPDVADLEPAMSSLTISTPRPDEEQKPLETQAGTEPEGSPAALEPSAIPASSAAPDSIANSISAQAPALVTEAATAAAPLRSTFPARPLNPGTQSAAVSSFLRRASRLEQGSPIKSKPEAAEWVAAVRDGSADQRVYKRLLKLTVDFRINAAAGRAEDELVPGPGGGTRPGQGARGAGEGGALGLERMGDAEYEEEEAGMRAWEDGNLFDDLFVAICGSLQGPARIEELRIACFALLHRLVEYQFPLFTSTGRELDLLALLFQLRKEGRRGKQTLDACEAILISWSGRTDPMLGLGAVINNLKTTADGLGAFGGTDGPQAQGVGDESTLRTLVMGLKVLGRLLLRLPGEVIEEELSRATDVLRTTLTHANVELRRTAIETLVAANRQINNAAAIFELVGPLPTSQQDLLMYYFHKAGQQ